MIFKEMREWLTEKVHLVVCDLDHNEQKSYYSITEVPVKYDSTSIIQLNIQEGFFFKRDDSLSDETNAERFKKAISCVEPYLEIVVKSNIDI